MLSDPRTLPFFRELLTAGFTDPDPEFCEVTRAIVMVRRFTGRLEPNIKYAGVDAGAMRAASDAAEQVFEEARAVLRPVTLI